MQSAQAGGVAEEEELDSRKLAPNTPQGQLRLRLAVMLK